jgi:hypothetical protein
MSEGGEMQGPQTKGPLVKLLVEDSIAPARHAFVWSRRDRKSIVTLTRTTNPSISLALRAPHVRAGSEIGLPQAPKGPLVNTSRIP